MRRILSAISVALSSLLACSSGDAPQDDASPVAADPAGAAGEAGSSGDPKSPAGTPSAGAGGQAVSGKGGAGGAADPGGGGGAGGSVAKGGAGGTGGKGGNAGASGESGSGGKAGAAGAGGSGAKAGASGAAGKGGACPDAMAPEGAPLVAKGPCGLVYGAYRNRDETAAVNRLPDFSYAGYEGGGVAIPDVPVVATVDPGPGDDRAAIQAAIDAASQKPIVNGFRGAVLLRKGQYQIGDTLHVTTGGVVLRGEGQGTGGTVLVATAAKAYTLLAVHGTGTGLGPVAGTQRDITAPLVGVGARVLPVASTTGYAAGDTVVVVRTPNQAWIDALGMAPYGWKASSFDVAHERRVVAVAPGAITVDVPLVDALSAPMGGGFVQKAQPAGRIAHVGVEDLRFDSTYASATDENHGWDAIELSRVERSWVRRVTVEHFGHSAVVISDQSRDNTVEDAAHLDPISQITGGRRYPFYVDDGTGNLFQRCYTREGRHSFVTGSRVAGPNVWLDSLAEQTHADDGPHHRWATGVLFDNTKSGQLRVQNRKDAGSGHGWAGAQTLFFNAEADTLVCQAPPSAMSWAIGCVGKKVPGQWAPEEPDGMWQSAGKPVAIRSLYLAQLEERLGAAAVDAVARPAQKKGSIWPALAAWKGDGALAP